MRRISRFFMKHRQYWWIVAIAAGFIALTALSAVFVPSVRSRALWGYRYGRSVVLGDVMDPDTIPATVTPLPSPETTTALKDQVQHLEEKVAALEYTNAQYRTVTNEIQDNVKSVIVEVAKTNDLLDKRQSEWLATLKRIQDTPQGSSEVSALNESSPSGSLTSASTQPSDGKINLNIATAAQLDTLPGIGPAYAERIIAYRKEKGNFTKVDDLTNVPGIGPATLEKIRNLIEL